jgi:hypothetical protein
VLLPSFEFVGKVTDEIFRLTESTPATRIILGAEDIRRVYRRFGTRLQTTLSLASIT